jgi:hypothetical protein
MKNITWRYDSKIVSLNSNLPSYFEDKANVLVKPLKITLPLPCKAFEINAISGRGEAVT